MNLWFVRTVPGKPEEVLANPVLATIKTGKFASAPVRIQLDGGTAIVRVNASFSIDSGPGGDLLTFVTERRMTWLPLQESRDALPDIKGGSQTTIPLPGPDEVISFEMPPVRFKGRPALPDQFAIRVQVTPISPIQ